MAIPRLFDVGRAAGKAAANKRSAAKSASLSGRVPKSGLALMVVVTIASGILMGEICHLVHDVSDLVLFGPIFAGILVGIPVGISARPAHCRKMAVTIVLGCAAALIMMFSRLYFDSLDFYSSTIPQAIAKENQVDILTAQKAVDETQTKLGPVGAFREFIRFAAEAGVTIEDANHTSSTQNENSDQQDQGGINGWKFYLFMLFNVGLAAGIAGFTSTLAAPYDYCEACGKWHSKPTSIGSADLVAATALLAAFERHDWRAVHTLNSNPPQGKDVARVVSELSKCDGCGNGFVRITRQTIVNTAYKFDVLLAQQLTSDEVKAMLNPGEDGTDEGSYSPTPPEDEIDETGTEFDNEMSDDQVLCDEAVDDEVLDEAEGQRLF